MEKDETTTVTCRHCGHEWEYRSGFTETPNGDLVTYTTCPASSGGCNNKTLIIKENTSDDD